MASLGRSYSQTDLRGSGASYAGLSSGGGYRADSSYNRVEPRTLEMSRPRPVSRRWGERPHLILIFFEPQEWEAELLPARPAPPVDREHQHDQRLLPGAQPGPAGGAQIPRPQGLHILLNIIKLEKVPKCLTWIVRRRRREKETENLAMGINFQYTSPYMSGGQSLVRENGNTANM